MAKYLAEVVCILFGFCCAAITPSMCSSNQNDVHALLAFRAAIVDSLGALNSWNQTGDYCTWNGIRCSARHPDRVVEINLMSQGLVGSLSPHVANLSFLKRFNLRNNSFYGQIPQEIGRLRRLEYVEFSNNSFVGEIPRNVSQCPNLVYLNLIDNSLSGTIPVELGSLHRIQDLGLGKNDLSGSIPPFLGNLTTLIQLSLISSGLTGEIPESLAQLQKLKFLILSENDLRGRISPRLFNISTLLFFGANNNQFQGDIPANLGLTLPSLEILHLAYNQLSGNIPASLSNATSLVEVILGFNSFTGPMPKDLGRLSKLEYFFTTGNHIQDDISFISTFTNCTDLVRLFVGYNMLSGLLPISITNLSSQLEDLEIAETHEIHGNIPYDIGNLVGLSRLRLYSNNLAGPIPFSVGRLFNLHELRLGENGLTNEIPYSLGNLTLLNRLLLEENNLSGSIPQSLGNCTSLISLDFGNNNLGSSIPPEIMNLSSISLFLSLSYNAFTGSIPFEIGSFRNLGDLDLSNNRLSGLIPNSLSSCTELQRLHLEGNLLEGEIPSALNDLKGLQDLDLSRNNLSGKIPIFLSRLSLVNLNLSFNRFKGEVPEQGVFGNKTAISVEGNTELCGGILELKLPPCPSSKSSEKSWASSLKFIIPTLVAGGLCITLCVFIFVYIYNRKIAMKNRSSTTSFDCAQFIRLSYGDILKATNAFSEGNLVGAGRFGSVYKGVLEDGETSVAVKVLNLSVKGASKSFIAECMALKGVRHRNLLKLLSVCESTDFQGNEFKALIYEFMSNGSLEDLLYHNRDQEDHAKFHSLNMIQRLKISIDIAHALEYLHIGTDSPIIHGDLKPSNVLLDDDMTAHVGDFGLSKVVSDILKAPESCSTAGIRGTIGYIPPEYGTSNSVSTKGDVYSYGIILLEMFTGKRPTDEAFDENLNLHDFVISSSPNHMTEIIDPHVLQGRDMNNKTMECVVSALSLGVACSRKVPTDRMCMADVVRELCKIRNVYVAQDLS